jgi:tripeptide aminopeptidase
MDSLIVDYFISLVKIDSESKSEKALAMKLVSDLKNMGAETWFDNAHEKTGGDCGNLYARIPGTINKEPIMFCAHMDTVVPGKGVKPIIIGDLISSDGKTILGADDKSGICEIICGIKKIMDSGLPYPPIEILFTISEEIGLLGAKYSDLSRIKAKMCYALDSHDVGSIMIGAPSQSDFDVTITGKKAHAGVEPEKGINAITIASDAIKDLPLGRIDQETTGNIGVIKGGVATNIVPDKVFIKGEVRSHSEDKLQSVLDEVKRTFEQKAGKYKKNGFVAQADVIINKNYSSFLLQDTDDVVVLAKKVTQKLKIDADTYKGGGGSDANILNGKGISTVVIGTGMNDVHGLEENIQISSLITGTEWIYELIKTYASE